MSILSHFLELITAENNLQHDAVVNSINSCSDKDFDYLYNRGFITCLRWNQLRNGELSIEKAKEIALKAYNKKFNRELNEDLEDATRRINCPVGVSSIRIVINWVRNRTWGYNPQVEARVGFTDGTYATYEGTASGCGYDKRSAAVANALNKCTALLSEMAKYKYHRQLENPNTNSNAELIAYGAGYGILPYLEGGVGFSCHEKIFNLLGFKKDIEVYETRKGFEVYQFTK